MKILGIESASITASCAVSENERLLCEYSQSYKKTHSEKLMPLIISILEDNELTLKDIDAIAISKGPGSYTGLRIGASVGKGLAQAAALKVIAVPTMMALASNIYDVSSYIVPIMDAKGNRAYSGIYRWINNELVTIKEQFPVDIDELISIINQIDGKVILNGDGSLIYRDILSNGIKLDVAFAEDKFNILKASSVNYIAYKMAQKGQVMSCYDFVPEYLRPSQAERMSEANENNNQANGI